ncbi:MAG: hypothetical protein U9R50_10005 [Campylobacterota bacterium]|nr:hypothetical protein [Campylobacterota bacterium]
MFEDLLRQDKKLLEKLTESGKYKNNKMTLNKAYKVDMDEYLLAMVKNIVFHNLSNVEPLFKDVLHVNIKYNTDEKILKSIDKRHDIVHRNGKTKTGEMIEVSYSELENTISTFDKLLKDIDSQIITKHGGN